MPETLRSLAGRYDAFLVDQFGVLLDGSAAYPHAPEALRWLAATGKSVILLSNSGKRSEPNAQRLVRLGFDRTSFRLVLSSGEAAHKVLLHRNLASGTPVWLHARDGDMSAVEGLPVTLVEDPADAAFLILAGSQADTIGLECYAALLALAAERRVPMLCSNPDLDMLTPQGRRPGAGRIAALYQRLGGPVELVGKPHPLIYSEAARLLPGVPPRRILCIGDSPAHDIAGGQTAGFATALVRTGIHAALDDDARRELCKAEGAIPDHVLDRFALAED